MLLSDLTLEVRDRTLARVGQITAPFMNLKATTRWCGVGEWTLTLPGDHAMVDHLVQDGSGIILLGPDGTSTGVILSGPTETPQRKRDAQNPDGTFTFSGVTDDVHLLDALAYPQPSNANVGTQSVANDVRTAKTEALLLAYVNANIGPGAPAGRKRGIRSSIVLSVDAGRGVTQTKSPRFQNLLELLREIVTYDSTLGFRVVQVGTSLRFEVIDSRDMRATVRFDVQNGTLTSEEYQQSGPGLTYAIVAGQGEGTLRQIIARTTVAATAAETSYGRVREAFIDQRDTNATAELEASGDEALAAAAGGASVKVIPADDSTMQFGRDWRPGDLVTIVVDDQEMPTAVTETALLISPDGVRAGAALGDVSSFTAGDTLGAKVDALDSRVSQIERANMLGSVPTGFVGEFATASAPAGWLTCDGSAVSRTTYAALFAAIGTTYGVGDGSTTFNLPNRKGRVGVGRDAAQAEFDVLGELGGSKTVTIGGEHLPVGTVLYGGGTAFYVPISAGNSSNAYAAKTHFSPAQGQTALPNLQPYIVMNYCIKT